MAEEFEASHPFNFRRLTQQSDKHEAESRSVGDSGFSPFDGLPRWPQSLKQGISTTALALFQY